MLATKMIILCAVGKKFTELPPTPNYGEIPRVKNRFLVPENHMLATKMIILCAVGKKFTELPPTPNYGEIPRVKLCIHFFSLSGHK